MGCSNIHQHFLDAARTSKHKARLHKRLPSLTAALSGLPSGCCLDLWVLPRDLSGSKHSESLKGWDFQLFWSKTDLLGSSNLDFRIKVRIVKHGFQLFDLVDSPYPPKVYSSNFGIQERFRIVSQSFERL